ncbi:MAG TPA: helix-hairpin-helix domain-containing protein [Saprospiraceae bacterium]|nr:helix-hairpin-helix domain-containing protein [Saprospiraceae bacterium]HRO07972.1 helix-hairpin-helix domain-containing protein [Saprospiraceae bacterium]HRP41467.1 helix-hairpin-helix domain-containing protein [Saprospiraceae bacterium]
MTDLDQWFGFTLRERMGIAAFLVSMLIIYGIGEFWPYQLTKSHFDASKYMFPSDSMADDTFYPDGNTSIQAILFDNNEKAIKSYLKFPFDPNAISYDSLLLLGFSKYAAKSLTNYVSKGGKIHDVNKLKSIYGIDSNLINNLSGYIRYPSRSVKTEYTKQTYSVNNMPDEPIEINSADTTSLYSLKILGKYNANKIMKFRNKAGGFMRKDQLVEFGILSDSVYALVEPYLTVDPMLFRKINLNTADYRTFIQHPYFDKETISKILKYRKQHGDFKDVHHLRRIRALSEEVGERIIPYLTVE